MNNKRTKNFLQSRLNAFRCAIRGVGLVAYGEQSAWVHCAATVLVLLLSSFLCSEPWEWIVLILCITVVWLAEILNSAIEVLADKVSPEHCSQIRNVKDIAAGAVLVTSIGVAIVGLIIFIPHVF